MIGYSVQNEFEIASLTQVSDIHYVTEASALLLMLQDLQNVSSCRNSLIRKL